ncbi:MAG: LLM class flavin-dependent oxidoreductase [Dehalococcoidia bacterium]
MNTNKIQFGPLYTTMEEYIGPVEFAEKAEEWGYDAYWVPDYVTLSPMDAFVLLAAVAQRTSRLRLGTAVVVVPFRSPFQLAKASLSVDALSNGRFTLGVGIGGAVPRDFEVAQVDIHQRGRISNETIEITRRLFAEENVTHEGRYYRFQDLTMEPRPVQKPGIPIWIGSIWNNGFAEGVMRRAARYGDGFFPTDTSQEEFKKAQARIKELAASYGRDPEAIQWGLLTWTCLGDSKEEARQIASREISKRLGSQWNVQVENGYALGTPQDIIDTLKGYVDLGLTNFVIDPACPPSEMLQQFEILAKEVLPQFRSAT